MMRKPLTVPGGGEYVDVDWSVHDGMFMVATIQRPDRIVVFDAPDANNLMPLAWLKLERWGLYLRQGVDDSGAMCIALQDGRDRNPATGQYYPAIVAIFNGSDRIREVECPVSAYGQGGIEVVGMPDGWWVWIQTSNRTFWRGRLSPAGTWTEQREWPIPMPDGTSQGFTQGSRDGTIRFLDIWRGVFPGLACPNDDAGLVVGQNGDAGPDRIRGHYDGVTFLVSEGTSYEPHVVRGPNNLWLAAARTPAGPAITLLQPPFQAEAPAAPPPVVEPPPPTPEPHTDPKEPTVSIPKHFNIVQAVSDANPSLLAQNSPESMTELLWRTVHALRNSADPAFGLLSKSEGEKHTIIGGVRVGVDALSYGDSDECVDIFGSTGDGPGTGSLTWDVKPRRESNKRVVPPPFAGVPVPSNPPPGPGPNPPTQPPPAADPRIPDALLAIADALHAINARVESIERTVGGATGALVDKANQVVGKIDELQRDVQQARAAAEGVQQQIAAGIHVRVR